MKGPRLPFSLLRIPKKYDQSVTGLRSFYKHLEKKRIYPQNVLRVYPFISSEGEVWTGMDRICPEGGRQASQHPIHTLILPF